MLDRLLRFIRNTFLRFDAGEKRLHFLDHRFCLAGISADNRTDFHAHLFRIQRHRFGGRLRDNFFSQFLGAPILNLESRLVLAQKSERPATKRLRTLLGRLNALQRGRHAFADRRGLLRILPRRHEGSCHGRRHELIDHLGVVRIRLDLLDELCDFVAGRLCLLRPAGGRCKHHTDDQNCGCHARHGTVSLWENAILAESVPRGTIIARAVCPREEVGALFSDILRARLSHHDEDPLVRYHILRLVRIANVFTALADILAGYAVVQGTLVAAPELIWLLLASACLYSGGIALNDRFDLEQDRRERPERPLPRGDVSLRVAHALIAMLLLGGLACAALAGKAAGTGPTIPLGVAVLLLAAIVGYDAGLKKTLAGPPVMGLCRGLNVLLGMSFAVGDGIPWELHHLMISGAMALYVTGVTSFARREADEQIEDRRSLTAGIGLVLAALLMLGAAYFPLTTARRTTLARPELWWLLLGVVSVPLVRRLLVTWTAPSPKRIQQSVGLAIMSIIILDASVVFLVAGTESALVTIALLAPAMLLGRYFPPS